MAHSCEMARTQARALNRELVRLREAGDLIAAAGTGEEIACILRENCGEKDSEYLSALENLSLLYRESRNDDAAETTLRTALAAAAKAADVPKTAVFSEKLAELAETRGRIVEAEAHFARALALWQRAEDAENQVARCLSALARLCLQTARPEKAEAHLTQELDLRRKAASDTNSRLAQSLHDLGNFLREVGRYGGAEALLSEALAVSGAALGQRSRLSGVIHNTIGVLYSAVGNNAKAEPSFLTAVAILDAVDPDSLDAATANFNLAKLYEQHRIGARHLFQKAVDAARKRVGTQHPMYATYLLGLAGSLEVKGDRRLVEDSFHEALNILRRSKEHEQAYAAALRDYSAWYYGNGQFAEADRHLREAIAIRCQRLGEEHPYVVTDRWSLGSVLAGLSRWNEALQEFRQAASAEDHVLRAAISFGSEQQRTSYLHQLRTRRNLFVALALRFPTADAVRAAYDYVIKRKTLSFELSRLQRDAQIEKASPRLAPLLKELQQVDRQIIDKVMSGPGDRGLQEHQRFLTECYTKKADRESKISRVIPWLDVGDIFSADVDAVFDALPKDAAFVEFVRVQVIESKWAKSGIDPAARARYVAFVLSGENGGPLALIDLGDAQKIDLCIASVGAAILKGKGSRQRHFKVAPPGAAEAGTAATMQALAALVFWPVAPHLGGVDRLFIAPDGEIARIPFEILPFDKGAPLIDSHCISYLGSARDLLRFQESPPSVATEPIVIGDPDFDLAAPADATLTSHVVQRDWASLLPGFPALQGTRDEALRVASLLKVQPWLQQQALERSVRDCVAPRILHIATHGFFLPGEEYVDDDEFTPAPVAKPGTAALSAVDLGNPLLRSGLALAGVNTWIKGGSIPEEAEDGILTSADAALINLTGTELLVLSACDTGLGESLAGEGVWGFRRAFFLAGARSLVMSLWKVDDQCAAEIMTTFYERLLSGESRASALRNAQLAAKARHPDPYYWGAFICEGDPGPIGVAAQ